MIDYDKKLHKKVEQRKQADIFMNIHLERSEDSVIMYKDLQKKYLEWSFNNDIQKHTRPIISRKFKEIVCNTFGVSLSTKTFSEGEILCITGLKFKKVYTKRY